MVIYLPYEIIKIIFSFQEEWWWLANENRLISIHRLSQIPRPFLNKLATNVWLTNVVLNISPRKYYSLQFHAFNNIYYADKFSVYLRNIFLNAIEEWYSFHREKWEYRDNYFK